MDEGNAPGRVIETTTSTVATLEFGSSITQPTEVAATNTVVSVGTVTSAFVGKRASDIVPLPTLPAALAQARDLHVRTLTATSTVDAICAATAETAITFPTYASACVDLLQYSSACSCLGVTTSTTTVAQPTVTVTI
ncbi:hypothetical protein SUNI508_06653 [Seiridium unicorne]|uniref:Antifreeze protein n=1 Tax=Seiridium unicorne TaxID=138068 RepID=A0ABR2UZJ4_9PEZI